MTTRYELNEIEMECVIGGAMSEAVLSRMKTTEAADDASGYEISEKMRVNIRS